MVRVVVLVALIGCHYHRQPNAPGVIDPLVAPKDLTNREPEYPDDPGESMVMLTSGGLVGMGASSAEDNVGFVDLNPEVTLSWGEASFTHNDRADRLFIPKSVVFPPKAYGVGIGWSALRFTKDKLTNEVLTSVGPIYVEAQRSYMLAGFGGGIAIDPRTGATGPQVQGYFMMYFLRTRYLFGSEGGFEFIGGVQLKIPTTWVTRRRRS